MEVRLSPLGNGHVTVKTLTSANSSACCHFSGLFGAYPFEPGVRIGFHVPLATMDNSALMLNLNTAYFFRNRDNSNLLFGAELGWRLNKDESRSVNTFSIGTA